MHETMVIARRELRSFFLSPIAYVVGAAFLGVGGYLFFNRILIESAGTSQEARMVLFFQLMPIAMLILAPALAMRQWSEERKLGTLELLLTYPVTTGQLVVGKFLASMLFVGILLLLSLLYPISLSFFGDLDWGPTLGGFFGCWLLAAAYLAFGLFASALTRDQIVALVVSLVALGLLEFFTSSTIGQYLLGDTIIAVLGLLSPGQHFASITKGVVDLGDLVFYVVFCGLFLFLNASILEVKKRVG
ncbi:MAG: ABC transporter permease [Planctomycetota bacterium]